MGPFPLVSSGPTVMRLKAVQTLVIVAASVSLAGCNVTSDVGGLFSGRSDRAAARGDMPPPPSSTEVTGSIAPRNSAEPSREATAQEPARHEPAPQVSAPTAPVLPGTDGKDDVSRGRALFRAGNFAEAELAFDRAARMNPRDPEAWLGLAACYDRMRRFELADRAYVRAVAINGTTSEILNNQGFSYLLRGDLTRARNMLTAAQKKDPGNQYVQNNLQMLEQKERATKVQ